MVLMAQKFHSKTQHGGPIGGRKFQDFVENKFNAALKSTCCRKSNS